ncbi:MAG: FAD-binding oxidoreductase, partial [Nitrososphaerales archaeon]
CALYSDGVAIVPYGGGTGLMGGVLPLGDCVCLSLKRMKRVIKVDKISKSFVSQSGALLGDLEKELNKSSLILGHDPWSRSFATLGGSIAADGMGYLGGKLGSIRNQVLGLEVVLPNGEVISTRAVEHSSAGLDLKHLFIGSEGTLGIITQAVMRAYPYPEKTRVLGYSFESFQKGHQAVLRLYQKGVRPTSLDLDENRRDLADPLGVGHTRLHLVFSGLNREVLALQKEAEQIILPLAKSSLSKAQADEYWTDRHYIAEMVLGGARRRRRSRRSSSFDYLHVSLPAGEVIAFRQECLKIAENHGAKILNLGLWHGPSLFSAAMQVMGDESLENENKMPILMDRLLKEAQHHGGSMEYCHGVGTKLVHLMDSEHGNSLSVMNAIKQTLDPKGLMNPGKMFR